MTKAFHYVIIFIASVCLSSVSVADSSSGQAASVDTAKYEVAGNGTRRFEWDTETSPLWLKVLVDESSLGGPGAEIAEIFFPPKYEGESHPHELEIIYVLEGELGHIIDGVPHILKPGMVGIVKAPDLVIHKSESKEGARALVIWPLGKEVKAIEKEALGDPEARVIELRP